MADEQPVANKKHKIDQDLKVKAQSLQCILHTQSRSSNEVVKPITDVNLAAIKKAADIRQQQQTPS
jgi:hypothetical protein